MTSIPQIEKAWHIKILDDANDATWRELFELVQLVIEDEAKQRQWLRTNTPELGSAPLSVIQGPATLARVLSYVRRLAITPAFVASRWRAEPQKLSQRQLRILYVTLHALYSEELADAWMTTNNDNELFGGETPLHAIAGGLDPEVVIKLLEARLSGSVCS